MVIRGAGIFLPNYPSLQAAHAFQLGFKTQLLSRPNAHLIGILRGSGEQNHLGCLIFLAFEVDFLTVSTMAPNVFAVPVFFIVFRETLEASIIISVLLAFIKQTLDGPAGSKAVYKKLVRQVSAHFLNSRREFRTDEIQVWIGSLSAFLICLIIGGGIIGAFYGLGSDTWAGTEYYWEGSFCIFASLIITILGAALLRISKMQEKWRGKIAKSMEEKVLGGEKTGTGTFKKWCAKYAMFLVPFVTVLREGIEAIVFVAGVSFSSPAKAIPLPVVMGLLAGSVVGVLIYL